MDSRSPIQHALVLPRINPDRPVARFHSLMIERDLFGAITLARNCGQIGTGSRAGVQAFGTVDEAGPALEALARVSGVEVTGTDKPHVTTSGVTSPGMRHITAAEIEAMARELLRETIEASGWYPDMRPQAREARIEQDVDLMWRLMAEAARERLEQDEWGKSVRASGS